MYLNISSRCTQVQYEGLAVSRTLLHFHGFDECIIRAKARHMKRDPLTAQNRQRTTLRAAISSPSSMRTKDRSCSYQQNF